MVSNALARTSLEPGGVGLIQYAAGDPGPDEVRLSVSLCGLCGSDAHVFRADAGYEWVVPATVLGHEAVGVIDAVGSNVPDWLTAGTRVVPVSLTGCGACGICMKGLPQVCPQRTVLGLNVPGAAADQCLVPWHAVVPVPESLPDTTAVLAEPASVAWRAVEVAGVSAGDRVIVSGTGTIGILAGLTAQHRGAHVTLIGRPGPSADAKSRLVASLGLAFETESPAADSVDAWIEGAGSVQQLRGALEALRPGGQLAVVGLYAEPPTFDINQAVRKELSIRFSYASVLSDFHRAMDVLRSKPGLGEMLVTTFPLESARDVLQHVASGHSSIDTRQVIKAAMAPAGVRVGSRHGR